MDRQQAIREFLEKIEWVHENDFGDFKRKVGLYLNRLENQMGDAARSERNADIFRQIRYDVIYQPSGDLNQCREDTVELAKKLL